jgi:transposase
MGRPYNVDNKLLSFAHETMSSCDCDEFKRALCVILGHDAQLTVSKISQILHISERSVYRYRDEIFNIFHGTPDPRDEWGGRRNSLLSEQEEIKFLNGYYEQSLKGEIVHVKIIHNDLEQILGRSIPIASTYNMLHRNGWRKLKPDTCHPKADPVEQEKFKKNIPGILATTIKQKNVKNLPVSLFFQDEARFGRLSTPKSCWSPYPDRPMVHLAIIRQFRYIYASVCPKEGRLYYKVTEKMNTKNMNLHLYQISQRMKSNFVIMILDGASSHRSKDLRIPSNMALIPLPPYSPELNPTEQIWRMLRGDYFGNKIFDSLQDSIDQAKHGLREMASNKESIIQLTTWPWIANALTHIN